MEKKFLIITLFLFSAISSAPAFAADVDVMPPIVITTAVPMAAETESDNAVTLKATPEGYLITSSADGTSGGGGSEAVPPTTYTNIGSDNATNVKASAGVVFSVSASNSNASLDRYILLHDKATAPIATDVPLAAFVVYAQGQTIIGTDFFTNAGIEFSNGIGFCYSSTEETCTPADPLETTVILNYE